MSQISDIDDADSVPATVTVEVGAAETLIVHRAECRARKNEWRVKGTSSISTPHFVTVYAGSTVDGPVIADNVQVDNLGAWSARSKGGSPVTSLAQAFQPSVSGPVKAWC